MTAIQKEQIYRWLEKPLPSQDLDSSVSHVTIDSRTAGPGSLFVALKGERQDGEDYIPSALEKGASLVLSRRMWKDQSAVVQVKDPALALGQIAAGYLSTLSGKRIALTGSSGKTTTKDMLYYILKTEKRVCRTLENYNNEIGLPLTALRCSAQDEAMVFEMGMSSFGEIEYLSHLVRPDMALITNIGTCHIEYLGSRENILKAKMEIVKGMQPEGLLLLNIEDDLLRKVDSAAWPGKIVRCGLSAAADYWASEITSDANQTCFCLHTPQGVCPITLPLLGDHNVLNATLAAAAAHALGVSLAGIKEGLAAFKPSSSRMQITQMEDLLVIDDSYNANPESMQAVLATMRLREGLRKVAVLGDMLELGERSASCHRQVLKCALDSVDLVLTVGEKMKEAAQALCQQAAHPFLVCFEDCPEALLKVPALLQSGDTVLIKGSHGLHLENLAQVLTATRQGAAQ